MKSRCTLRVWGLVSVLAFRNLVRLCFCLPWRISWLRSVDRKSADKALSEDPIKDIEAWLRELEMNLRIKPRKRLKREKSGELVVPEQPNGVWSMDFMGDRLGERRQFRLLNVLDGKAVRASTCRESE